MLDEVGKRQALRGVEERQHAALGREIGADILVTTAGFSMVVLAVVVAVQTLWPS
jgi:hypothetical protein